MSTLRPISAKVKFRNTPDSDLLQYIPCIVTMSDGSLMEIEATDPLDAIKRVNFLLAKK